MLTKVKRFIRTRYLRLNKDFIYLYIYITWCDNSRTIIVSFRTQLRAMPSVVGSCRQLCSVSIAGNFFKAAAGAENPQQNRFNPFVSC